MRTVVTRLCSATVEAVRRGADVVHLSLQFHPELSAAFAPLRRTLAEAAKLGTVTVISAGNAAFLGSNMVLGAPGVVPVAMCDGAGRPASLAAYGPIIGIRGVLAPGDRIPGAVPEGYAEKSGTSYAAAIVTGALVLLRSLFPERPIGDLIRALRGDTRFCRDRPYSLVPPRLDGERALCSLTNIL